ncbi:hypothetical protein AB1P65_09425 [Roseibium alexandrii]
MEHTASFELHPGYWIRAEVSDLVRATAQAEELELKIEYQAPFTWLHLTGTQQSIKAFEKAISEAGIMFRLLGAPEWRV